MIALLGLYSLGVGTMLILCLPGLQDDLKNPGDDDEALLIAGYITACFAWPVLILVGLIRLLSFKAEGR